MNSITFHLHWAVPFVVFFVFFLLSTIGRVASDSEFPATEIGNNLLAIVVKVAALALINCVFWWLIYWLVMVVQ